jgi:hypothetical protein
MGIREEYQAFVEKQLNDWKAYTDRLRAQADQLGSQAKTQFDQQLETIRAKQNEAWDMFMKLKGASEDAWSQSKRQLDKAWEELRAASDRLTDQFRKK